MQVKGQDYITFDIAIDEALTSQDLHREQGSGPLLQQCATNELPQLTEAFHLSLASTGVTLARLGDDFVQYASILAAAGIETKEALEETGLIRLCELGVSADHANCMSRTAPQELCSLCCREPSMNLLEICDNSGNLLCFNCAEQRVQY